MRRYWFGDAATYTSLEDKAKLTAYLKEWKFFLIRKIAYAFSPEELTFHQEEWIDHPVKSFIDFMGNPTPRESTLGLKLEFIGDDSIDGKISRFGPPFTVYLGYSLENENQSS